MPIRKTPLITNYYYHIYNRSVGKIPIFIHQRDYERLVELIDYYRFFNPPLSFSIYKRMVKKDNSGILSDLQKKNKKLVSIISYCIMPNHFHLLLKQEMDNGIRTFLALLQNSYAKYFNIKNKRVGILFQSRFKAVLVEDDSQLLHLSRYIHLNPYTSLIIKDKDDLINYTWSSLGEYIGLSDGFCEKTIILNHYPERKDYLQFVMDRADYQRRLDKIKHLTHEELPGL